MLCTLAPICASSVCHRAYRPTDARTRPPRVVNIHPNASGFNIAAGAILGVCAGMLWTAQGSLMLAYPTESQKGKFIAIFWSIFNLGGVVGAAVSLGSNFDNIVRQTHISVMASFHSRFTPPHAV